MSEGEVIYDAIVRALPQVLPTLKFTDFPPWLRWWLVVASIAAVWGLGQIRPLNTRVTRLEERLPRPIAEELT